MLEVMGLVKRYGKVLALDGCSLTVPSGHLVGLLGPNGAGKTTVMRTLFGLAVPDAGTVRWAGRPVDTRAQQRFGYMPEERGLHPAMRVAEQVAYFGRLGGLSAGEAAVVLMLAATYGLFRAGARLYRNPVLHTGAPAAHQRGLARRVGPAAAGPALGTEACHARNAAAE